MAIPQLPFITDQRVLRSGTCFEIDCFSNEAVHACGRRTYLDTTLPGTQSRTLSCLVMLFIY